jgi:hypothetical protein
MQLIASCEWVKWKQLALSDWQLAGLHWSVYRCCQHARAPCQEHGSAQVACDLPGVQQCSMLSSLVSASEHYSCMTMLSTYVPIYRVARIDVIWDPHVLFRHSACLLDSVR